VVHYAWHREDIWVFTITPDGVEAHRARIDSMANADLDVATRPDISFREFVYLGRSLLQENAGRRSRAIRRKLMEVLIPDWVREGDDPNHMMIIIPANRLHGLAFQALLDGDTPLIEKTAVMYAPSLDLVQGMLARDEADTSLLRGRGLVCAQWQFEHPEYDPLPYAQVEAEAVCAAAGVTDVRIGEGFSREELQRAARSGALTGYDWLHFATHAYYDRATGAFTGLIAGSDVIGLEDIREWRLHAKVVTLSACQTGRGKWYYGDEIAGLTQAFLGAGAHTVVASQWLAHDQHSGELMADMYQKMRSGRSPAAALAEAQRGAHRRGVAAYYWAPFCAFGVM
jgi:CHAT domain-containing protein